MYNNLFIVEVYIHPPLPPVTLTTPAQTLPYRHAVTMHDVPDNRPTHKKSGRAALKNFTFDLGASHLDKQRLGAILRDELLHLGDNSR